MHDRIQQASNSLLSQEENISTHVQIGKILSSSLKENELEDSLFEVTNHLNYGIGNSNLGLNYKLLIELNYRAGKKASLSNAREPALNYFQIAYSLLKQLNSEGMDVELAFSIEYELGNALYLNGKFQKAEERFLDTITHYTEEDKIFKVQNMRIILYINQGDYAEAIKLGLDTIKMYGIHLNPNPSNKFILSEYLRIKRYLLQKSQNEILEMSPIVDKKILNCLQILVNIYSAAFFTNLNLTSLITLNLSELTISKGNSLYSGFAIVNLANLISGLGEYSLGYEFGLLALQLNERYGNNNMKVKIIHILTGFILHWNIPN
jgi:predicted ATPase